MGEEFGGASGEGGMVCLWGRCLGCGIDSNFWKELGDER